MNPISKPASLLASVFSIGAYLTLTGCSNVAAPESTPAIAIGEKTASNSTSLLAGREVLMTRCAACHRAPSVEKYSAEQWRGIVGRMSPLAKLNPSQQAQLLAYVLAAKETPLHMFDANGRDIPEDRENEKPLKLRKNSQGPT